MAVTNSILTLCSTLSEALTTFSSFSAEVVAMLQQCRFALAAGTASLHLFDSLALTVLGLQTVGLLWAR
jgi:CrcB protein